MANLDNYSNKILFRTATSRLKILLLLAKNSNKKEFHPIMETGEVGS